MGNGMFNDEQLAHAGIVQKETEDALGWWKDRALKAEAKLADKYLIEEQYEAACGDRDGLLRMVETLREWKDKLEAERDDIAAWAESWMKRVAAAERERDEAREKLVGVNVLKCLLVDAEKARDEAQSRDDERRSGNLIFMSQIHSALDRAEPSNHNDGILNRIIRMVDRVLAAEAAPPAPRGEFAIIASLVAAMKRWGSEEDGVPDFAWKAYTAGAAYIVTPPPPSDNKGCAA